jgi:hypothetical protein
MELSPTDWTTLATLTAQVGLPPERVEMLRRRIENASARRGSPFTLLAGNPNSGIELLLSRWISPEVADRLEVNRPLVIGPQEQTVRPKFGSWAGVESAELVQGHLIALQAASRPPKDTLMQLASLSFIDQLVLVTRLAQPFTQSERNLAAALNSVSATVRVLIVGVPGEEPTERDLAEVAAYAGSYMRQAGFGNGRCLGGGVWFTKGDRPENTISDVGSFLRIDQIKVISGRDQIFRHALVNLFAQIESKSGSTTITPHVAITPGERERIVREFSTYLSALGNKVTRDADGSRTATKDTIREYCLDAIRGWAAYVGVEGHWMKYVETLRPGAHTALLAEAKSALDYIDYEPIPITQVSSTPAAPKKTETPLISKFFTKTPPLLKLLFTPAEGGSTLVQRAMVEAKRAAIALLCGLIGYWILSPLINARVGVAGLPLFVISLINAAGFLIAAVLGYGIGCRIFRTGDKLTQPHTDSKETHPHERPPLRNWVQVESRLTAWFATYMTDSTKSCREECRALAERLEITESKTT